MKNTRIIMKILNDMIKKTSLNSSIIIDYCTYLENRRYFRRFFVTASA